MKRNLAALALGFLIGAAAGAAGGHLARGTNAPDTADDSRAAALKREVTELRKQVGVLERKLARKAAAPLEAYNMDRGAVGSDALDVGPALDEAERAVSGLLRGLDASWHPPWILVDSGEEMSRFFERVAAGPVIEGHRAGLSARPPDGATIRFPAGRHALDAQALSRFDPFPRELVIEGAGMGQTLLVMNDDIRPPGSVFHLRIKNATVDTNRGRLLRASNEAFSLRLEKCRIVGFDGAQGGTLLSGDRGAIFASDCRFEAGYGGRPAGLGTLLTVAGPLLARFERCTFVGPFLEPLGSGDRSAQVYLGCSFDVMPSHFRPDEERYRDTVRIEECRFDYLADRAAPVTRMLSDINDAW